MPRPSLRDKGWVSSDADVFGLILDLSFRPARWRRCTQRHAKPMSTTDADAKADDDDAPHAIKAAGSEHQK